MSKKILIFSLNYFPKFIGGAEVAIQEITNRIDPSDIEFHMVTLRFDSALPKVSQEGNVLVHRIGFTKQNATIEDLKRFPLRLNKYWYQFAAAKKALSLHKKYHYDAIWAMMAHSSGVPAALFKMMEPKVPYILTLQEGDPIPHIERSVRPLWPLFTRAFTLADIIQPISSFLARWARDRGFTGPIEIIPNGGNDGDFLDDFSEKELQELRVRVGRKEGTIFLVSVSRLVHKNGLDDVIRAMKLLPEKVHFLVVGDGPDDGMLKALAASEGVSERVHFVGHVPNIETPKYRKIADIFIRPSRSEGLGNSFISAMAAKLPVIATQEGGIADFLFDAKRNPDKETTGWAVDPNAPEQIAVAVLEIIEHPEQTKQVVAAAYRFVKDTYTWSAVTAAMKERVFGKLG